VRPDKCASRKLTLATANSRFECSSAHGLVGVVVLTRQRPLAKPAVHSCAIEMVGPTGLEPVTNGFRFAAISGLSGLCLQHSVAALAVRRQVSTPSQPTGLAWLGVDFGMTRSAFADFDAIHAGSFLAWCTYDDESAALTIVLRAQFQHPLLYSTAVV